MTFPGDDFGIRSIKEPAMSEEILRKVLWADAIGSGAALVFTIVGAGLLGRWLDISAWIPLTVGLVLIPWVYLLVRTVRRDQLRAGEVALIVAGNLGWVIAAAILIIGFPNALSTTGNWVVGIFSAVVLELGVAEWMGLRDMTHQARHVTA
jgi:hypothetical protein